MVLVNAIKVVELRDVQLPALDNKVAAEEVSASILVCIKPGRNPDSVIMTPVMGPKKIV